jgi:L-aspartate oxidase
MTPDAPLDLLVLGSGVAGLTAAVEAADLHGLRVGVLTKGALDQATTRWAQGGVAAVLGGDPDSTDLHLADTLAAGAGLCDADAVRVLVDEGPGRVNALIALGALFDRDGTGALQLAREGGHSLPRIVHAGGAATGAEIERALVAAVHATATAIHEHAFALDLLTTPDGRCVGVRTAMHDGSVVDVHARHVLLATGGAGQLFAVTTTPVESTGDGVAMALRAGVAVADVEFVQFHPTALHHPFMPRPLLSEALRGHGALVRDVNGERFVDELLPRDQVSRAMTRRMLDLGVDHCFLDATALGQFDERFPTIAAALSEVGLDPATDWLPIAPAAHYLCGGVVTDLSGATSMPGLWAAGEVACSGVHGANRLASNSLLEGMVFGFRVVDAIADGHDGPGATGAMRSVRAADTGEAPEGVIGGQRLSAWSRTDIRALGSSSATPSSTPTPASTTSGPDTMVGALRDRLQQTMTRDAGVLRSATSLADALEAIDLIDTELGLPAGPAEWELANLIDVGRALIAAATSRTESRGAHTRSDAPELDPAQTHRLVL